jgi:hypothetical protein
MSIPVSVIIPLIAQLLTLSLKIADIIDRSDSVNADDKAAMRAAIKKASNRVTYWNKDGS